jgi:glycosyltransferase involved in cell wall biosynthesis
MPAGFWQRYLDVFDAVSVVARIHDVEEAPHGWHNVASKGVSFVAVPYYVGPLEYLRKARQIRNRLKDIIEPRDTVLLRVGSQIAAVVEPALRRGNRPFALEVVGDPWDVFAPGTIDHPLRPFFRQYFYRQLRRQCANATAVAYVTERALQRRYPASSTAYTTYYSSIELDGSYFVESARSGRDYDGPLRICMVGALEQAYKAPDVLIRAALQCIRSGFDVRIDIVGGGRFLADLTEMAGTKTLGNRVHLWGSLPAGDPVRERLDHADLFVLPSKTEGLPRAMIEAMARGLPCIGTAVGGIPELLDPEDLVPSGDVDALATKIMEVARDPVRMTRMSERNLRRAQGYREDVLRERRRAFYQYIRTATETWVAAGGGG